MTSIWRRAGAGGVRVWAHRGGGFEAPSNTLYAMERASPLSLEMDLRPSRDLQKGSDDGLIVFHDAVLDNVTNGSGAIADHRFADLARLDAAHWWAPGTIHDHAASVFPLRGAASTDESLRPCRFVDVLERFPRTAVNVDLKADGMEAQLASVLRRFDRLHDVIVTSFDDRRVARFRRLCPEAATGPGAKGVLRLYAASRLRLPGRPARHEVVEPPGRHGRLRVDKGFVEAAHARGLGVHVWTVNDTSEAEHLVGLDVDGIMTDLPSVIEPVVRSVERATGPPGDVTN